MLDSKVMKFSGGTVWLDVGGTHQLKTGVDVLCSVEGSLMAKMFSGRHELRQDEAGTIFIDRDGETFLTLVNYLRNGRKDLPAFENIAKYKLFEEELEFWTMKDDLNRLRKEGKPQELQRAPTK